MGRASAVGTTARWAAAGGPKRMAAVARSSAKAPLVLRADERLRSLRTVSVPALLAEAGVDRLLLTADAGEGHDWQIGALEQALLQAVAARPEVATAFEVGTFDGGTTLALAEAIGEGGVVHTIDLPADAFDRTQDPDAFGGDDVGRAYRAATSPAVERIVQHRGDSTTFDFSPWHGTIDLVLVDGAHDHEHGVADSRTALDLVAPGGWVFWDDAEPWWHGLVDGIIDTVGAARLTKVARTSLLLARG